MTRILLVALVIGLVALFFALGLHEQLTLASLQAHQERFAALQAAHPWRVALTFFAVYVLVTGLSLPGAAIMTLAAGALFGLVTGTVLVSFASAIGATVAFLVSRFLLHDPVQRRFGDRLRAINAGIERDGAFYLFTLRLVPVFPFFIINLVMGLTPIRTWTFYWVSQVGMLAGTVVYINAGTQLARVTSVSDVMSPMLVLSFVLLGLFPWMAKWVTRWLQRRRVYARWTRPRSFDRNLVVIGAGAAGLVSAYIAATVKAKVTLVEAGRPGGDCLYTGCVPSKVLISSARMADRMRHADRYGIAPHEPQVRFREVMARVRAVIEAIEPHDSVERYTRLGVEVLQGHARIIDPWTVEVALNDGGTQRLTTRSIVIATGAKPMVPSIPGIAEVGHVTSDTLWDTLADLDEAPRRLVVLGGGPVGCELAQALARLGAQVTVVEQGRRLLPREDEEVASLAEIALEENGVSVLSGHEAVRCERDGDQRVLVIAAAGIEQRLPYELLLCAVGRRARLAGYGLEELGIPIDRTVITNDYLETLYPNIFAAGDVAGPYQFTHAASHQAWYATVNALFGDLRRYRADYSVLPRVTFIDPEIASVGLTEQAAREQGTRYEVTRLDLERADRARTDAVTRGFVKVLTVPGKDRILGVTIVGEQAGELLAEFVLAMRHGLGLNKILGTVHAYPTLAEANRFVAGEWRRAHAPRRLLAWVERWHAWKRG